MSSGQGSGSGPVPADVSATAQARTAAAFARRTLSGRVLSATLRVVSDLDIAEESTADAFLLALQHWPQGGVPTSVEAWLITAARRRAVDRVRRAQLARRTLVSMASSWSAMAEPADVIAEAAVVGDDELRMVVLCCDPRLSVDDQVALTLRLACGISTAGIAAAHGISKGAMAARLTRAKAKLAAGGPRLDLPDDGTVDARLPAVARIVYLAFTLGHTRADGVELTDDDLADRAQYLARVLRALRPAVPAFTGLLALILLTRSRSAGRMDADGAQVLLQDADRTLWDRALIDEGLALLAGENASAATDPLVLKALIAAEHDRATSFGATDWPRVVQWYSRLLHVEPSPTVAVGRCVALSHLAGPIVGLNDLDEVLALGVLQHYPYAFAARAQLLGRLSRRLEAASWWAKAADLARTTAEREYFDGQARLASQGS